MIAFLMDGTMGNVAEMDANVREIAITLNATIFAEAGDSQADSVQNAAFVFVVKYFNKKRLTLV
jgi:hypothetical protein